MHIGIRLQALLFLILLLGCKASEPAATDGKDDGPGGDPPKEGFVETPALKKIKGNSIQIDPVMLNEQGISPETLVADLKMANIKSVHFFVAGYWDGRKDNQLLRPDYLQALKKEGIAVWIMLLGNCIYGDSSLPVEWQMEFLTPYPSQGIHFYSFHRPEFVDWQISRVKAILSNYDVAGIEFAESYFPEWKTLQSNGFYGDISAYARKKFTAQQRGTNAATLSFDYIRNDQTLYNKWMDFRVDAILDFNKKIKAAIKESAPEVLYAAWGMAVRKGTMAEIREHFGLDMVKMAKEVQPDVMVLQTAAQDWLDPALTYDYLIQYTSLAKAIQQANPKMALSIQADIVSLGYSNPAVAKRHPEWWLRFFDLSLQSGYYTNTAYEYAFAKKEGIWTTGNLTDETPRTLYKDASLQSDVLAEAVVPLSLIKEQGAHWKMVYTEKGVGWFYID
ncbi:hypothetical protein [Sphingobacterium sp. SGR-19]|uniref:hypothetical protein n=1 Tax=Sphingobacterium sp. SGR-19 TaxID=2710886 RepID=UPI0013EDF2DD|nr:hypothetical protein [Sphingobacterium sp. SGR-19]NGM65456.1 hypothetical protein [Sphingobacterium sp. SGR-19]